MLNNPENPLIRKIGVQTITVILVAAFTLQAAFAAPLTKNCMEEFIKLPETKANFNMEQFIKETVSTVVKVKAQSKLPFGKPKDSDKTDIGITVGCLKQFPESAGAITPMLKDIGIEMAKSMAGNSAKSNSYGIQNSPESEAAKERMLYICKMGKK